jgi:hypothetical protein
MLRQREFLYAYKRSNYVAPSNLEYIEPTPRPSSSSSGTPPKCQKTSSESRAQRDVNPHSGYDPFT